MSYDAGRIEPQFVHPNEAAPTGRGFGAPARAPRAPSATQRQQNRVGRAVNARRRSKLGRILPILLAGAAALVFASLTDGGSKARPAIPVASYLDHALEKVGLGLTEVTVKGQNMTRDGEIYDRLQLSGHRSIWLLDTAAARKRIETLPWILKASLKRVFPDRLYIDIEERIPRAVWNDGRQIVLIDATGRILGPVVKDKFKGLPGVFGAGAAAHVDGILTTINRIPELRAKIGLYEWTANRRWTLHLKSGRQILLPATGQDLALIQLMDGRLGRRPLDSNFEKLDMRVAGQAAIEFRK